MRRFTKFIMLLLCICMLSSAVAADSVTTMVSRAAVSSDGSCQVTMTVGIRLDGTTSGLAFPLPKNAKNVTIDGVSARTYGSGSNPNVILADLSYLNGYVGDRSMIVSFTLSDITVTEERKLYVQIPLLCGFEFPVQSMSFEITMPGDVTGRKPTFTSSVMQTSIDSVINYVVGGYLISGNVTQALQDKESITLKMQVDEDMFPGKLIIEREGNPEIVPMTICGVLALLYWIIFLRTRPVLRHDRSTLIEGVTAGELGCRLTAAGTDLTMMVFSWAQSGYLRVRVDQYGRVILEKRMNMGNERTALENRCFKSLFSRGNLVDATGVPYARLCRSVSKTVSGVKEMYRKQAGNPRLFRVLACGVSVFSGVCFAMNIANKSLWQTLLSVLLGVVGAVTAWAIQGAMYKIHVRGKIPLYVGTVCSWIWIVVGIIAGQVWMGIIVVLLQVLFGALAAYGGRRSQLGIYHAGEILGVQHYLKTMTQEEAARKMELNPDYFFDMLPYAIALGVDGRFAKAFAGLQIPECTYLAARKNEKRSAAEWALMVRKIADRMDKRQRRMEIEVWFPINIR